MKKVVCMLLTLVLVGTFVWASGQQEAQQQGGTSTKTETQELSGSIVWSDAEEGTDYSKLNESFMELHPGTEVSHEFIDPDRSLQIRIASGQMPDIWRNHNQQVSPADYAEFNLPLEDLGFTKDEIIGYDTGLGPDGKLYFLPAGSVYVGFHYNKAIFREAGIDDFPRTMEDFWKACEKLKAIGVTPLGTAFKDGWPMLPYFGFIGEDLAINLSGNPSFQADLADDDKLIKDGGYLDTLNFLREMNKRGFLDESLYDASWTDLEKGFANGEYGMYYHGSWFTQVIADRYGVPYSDLGMAPFPGSEFVSAIADGGFGIWKDSKNPEVAKAFLKYIIKEGRLARYGIIEPALVGAEPNNPLVKELLSYDIPLVTPKFSGADFRNRVNQAEIDTIAFLQEYIISENPNELVEEINKKWKAAE